MLADDDQRLVDAISVFLDRHWDPIGIYADAECSGPDPGTEYRRYAHHVLGMLRRGESAASISHYLTHQAVHSIQVGPCGRERQAAERLSAWFGAGRLHGRLGT